MAPKGDPQLLESVKILLYLGFSRMIKFASVIKYKDLDMVETVLSYQWSQHNPKDS